MLVKKASDLKYSEITDRKLYMNRRKFITGTAALMGAGLFNLEANKNFNYQSDEKLKIAKKGEYTVSEKLTPFNEASTYTNFYEFSTGKRSVIELSKDFKTRPWSLTVEGEVEKKLSLDVEELIQKYPLEERIYRWRCVEAWSMIIPWIGFPLSSFIKDCRPTSKAAFVEFTTLNDPKQMPGQKSNILKWPYVEALRLDEAQHPLALLGVGMYGEILPNQNGAPIRMILPWKYGFKSGKSIVNIRFTEKMPRTTWRRANSREYGFYGNVNPEVDHPRWTQARERRIGESGRRPTLMFNGYADQVANLYTGMDLRKNY